MPSPNKNEDEHKEELSCQQILEMRNNELLEMKKLHDVKLKELNEKLVNMNSDNDQKELKI